MITLQQLSKMLPNNPNPAMWLDALNIVLEKNMINTKERIAAFISQCSYESTDFTVLHENLNYSSSALTKLFPSYFPNSTLANKYARHPIMIANRIYANRMGNGDEESGDGYKFCGKGIIQITGRGNYADYSKIVYNDDRIIDNPDLLLQPIDAIGSAAWFWTMRKLNFYADTKDIAEITRRINGGETGLNDRLIRFERDMNILNVST